ncbi:hypothetical protein [Tortoise microvirus 82]|nr:hypothetical protein [Tortoise microvirus 82]
MAVWVGVSKMKLIGEVLTRRVGTAVAAYLVGTLGIPADLAMKFVLAGGVLLGIGADVAIAAALARFR